MDNRRDADFNGKNQREGLNEAANDDQQNRDVPARDDMSLDDSARNYGEVSGTTFGDQSNTAKFSNVGKKNQGDDSGHDNATNRGQDADSLYNKSNDFISGNNRTIRGEGGAD